MVRPTKGWAQEREPAPPPAQLADGDGSSVGTSEWTVAAAAGWGSAMFRSAGGEQLLMPTISWGRVLTAPFGPERLRGQFTWAVEATPLFIQLAPGRVVGIGIAPLVWRWHLTGARRWHPFAELGGGGLWTDADIPAGTARANYTLHATVAARWSRGGRSAPVIGYRFEHISNGNRLDPNPGVNAHLLVLGWSLLRPPKPGGP